MQARPSREASYSPVCKLWTTSVACRVDSAGQSAVTGPGKGSGSLTGSAWPARIRYARTESCSEFELLAMTTVPAAQGSAILAKSLPQSSKLGVVASPSKTFRSATQCVPTVPGQFATPLAHVNLSSVFHAPVQVAAGKKA